MGLGVVSDVDFAQELNNVRRVDARIPDDEPIIEGVEQTPIVPEIIRDDIRVSERKSRGRSHGDVNVPDSLRKLIANEHLEKGREAALEFAKEFGLSASSVSAYAKGATSTASYSSPSMDLQKYLTKRKTRLTKKALKVLQASLDEITPDKLSQLKVKDCASIAKDMSVISKNLEPDKETEAGAQRPQFVIYAPQVRDERSYDTIVVSDNY